MFEYLAVANSLILTLAVVRLIDALPPTFAPDRRHWPHALFVVSAILGCAQYWWAGWRFAGVSSWSQTDFLLFLLPAAILYAIARTLSSSEPAAIASFATYFASVHRRFFSLSAAFQFTLALSGWVVLGIPLTHPFRIVQAVLLLATLAGISTASPRYHALLAGFFLASFLMAFAVAPEAAASS